MREWAGDLVNSTQVRPLTQQPGTLEDVAGYTRSMAAEGHPPCFVIYAGLGTPGGPQQVGGIPHCVEPCGLVCVCRAPMPFTVRTPYNTAAQFTPNPTACRSSIPAAAGARLPR